MKKTIIPTLPPYKVQPLLNTVSDVMRDLAYLEYVIKTKGFSIYEINEAYHKFKSNSENIIITMP